MAFITRVVVVLKLVSCGSPTTISSLKPSKSLTFCLHFLTAVSLLLILYALIAVVCALIILILRVRRRNSRGNRKRDLTKQKDEGESHQPHRGGVHSGDEIGSD